MAWAFARSGLIGLAAVVVVAAPAAAAPTDRDLARLSTAQRFFTDRGGQSAGDGGLALGPGGTSSDLAPTEAWGALGLAAARVNAQDQAQAGGPTLYTYLGRRVAPLLSRVPDLSLFTLLAVAVGGDVHDLGGVDLVPGILDAQVPDGQRDAGGFGDQAPATVAGARATALAALALKATHEASAVPAADAGVDWLLAHQDPVLRAWPLGAPDVETTALAIQAIVADRSGPAATLAASGAQGWLQAQQRPDGGIGPDVPATAAAAMGLIAAGVDPHNVSSGGGPSLLDALGAAQDPSTGVVGGPARPTLTTGSAMLAFAGVTLPFGPIPRGGAGADPPPQGPPAGLPRGPTLPVEVGTPSTPATTPTAPAPAASAPVIQPAARAPAGPAAGVRRVPTRRTPQRQRRRPRTDGGAGDGGGLGGEGTGAGGGGGTLSTPGAPDRAGGGGGAQATVRAPAAGTPPPSGARRGGTPTRSQGDRAREVAGTLIGRDSATPGAAGGVLAAPGAAGARGGGRHAPWWVVALVVLLAAGLAAGARLDRRRPDFAL